MTEQKIQKYTLIDGFDKLDLSAAGRFGAFGATDSSPGDWIRLTRRAAVPEKAGNNIGTANAPLYGVAYNFKFVPTPTSYKYLPDLFRFLTGRRFAFDVPAFNSGDEEISWRLVPPLPAETIDHPTPLAKKFEGVNASSWGDPHGQEFWIDLRTIPKALDKNFEVIESNFRTSNYFSPGVDGKEEWTENTIYDPTWGRPGGIALDHFEWGAPWNAEKAIKAYQKILASVGHYTTKLYKEGKLPFFARAMTLNAFKGKQPLAGSCSTPSGIFWPVGVNNSSATIPFSTLSVLPIGYDELGPKQMAELWRRFTSIPTDDLLGEEAMLALSQEGLPEQAGAAQQASYAFRFLHHLMFLKLVDSTKNFEPWPQPMPFHTYFVSEFPAALSDGEREAQRKREKKEGRHYIRDYTLSPTVEVKPRYNFYNKDYENVQQGANIINEWQLPNLYTYYAYKNSSLSNIQYFKSLVTLGVEGGGTWVHPTWEGGTTNKTEFTLKDYYGWTKRSRSVSSMVHEIYRQLHDAPHLFTAPQYNTVILADKNLLNATKNLRKSVPYGVEIDLGTPKPSGLMDLIQGSEYVGTGDGGHAAHFMSIFLTLLANTTTYTDQLSRGTRTSIKHAHPFLMYRPERTFPQAVLDVGQEGGVGLSKIFNTIPHNFGILILPFFDLTQVMTLGEEDFKESYGPFINDWKNVKFADDINFLAGDVSLKPNPEKPGSYACPHASSGYLNWLTVQKLAKPIYAYLWEKKPTMKEVYEGKNCHTEIIAYEIVKSKPWDKTKQYNSKSNCNKRIQSIFIPNIFGEDNPLTYFDSQVFYDKEYVYEVYAHTLVVGAMYSYAGNYWSKQPDVGEYGEVVRADGGGTGGRTIDYTDPAYVSPSGHDLPYAIIVRAPYYNNSNLHDHGSEAMGQQMRLKVIDRPPLPPDISFHPYKDAEDKVLILLNQNYGQRALIPNSSIFAGDAKIIEEYKSAQQEAKPPGHIIYRTDDNGGTYEIYRSSKRPSTWADFRDANTVKKIALGLTDGSGVDDAVRPNRDYYYFARRVDVHGQISNPTGIFKLRIVKEEALPPYMVLKPYKFDQSPVKTSRTFKKYLNIALNPDLRQLIAPADPSTWMASAQDASVGYDLPKGSTGRYKFRITSKKTGKKIDINVQLRKKIKDNFKAQSADLTSGDQTAPITMPGHPNESGANSAKEQLLNAANNVNSSDDLC